MGQRKLMELPESGGHATTDVLAEKQSRSLWWLWALLIGVIVVGVWYFRGRRTPPRLQRLARAGEERVEWAWATSSCPWSLPPRSAVTFPSTSTDWEPRPRSTPSPSTAASTDNLSAWPLE